METDGSVMTQSERSSEIKILFGSETGTAEEFAFDNSEKHHLKRNQESVFSVDL